jgi:hypothetical protein
MSNPEGVDVAQEANSSEVGYSRQGTAGVGSHEQARIGRRL